MMDLKHVTELFKNFSSHAYFLAISFLFVVACCPRTHHILLFVHCVSPLFTITVFLENILFDVFILRASIVVHAAGYSHVLFS